MKEICFLSDIELPASVLGVFEKIRQEPEVQACCIFGGFLRDLCLDRLENVKDIDFRIWFKSDFVHQDENALNEYVFNLFENLFGVRCRYEQAAGTDKYRVICTIGEYEWDISVRLAPNEEFGDINGLIDRAFNSDAALCAVAATEDTVLAEKKFLDDLNNNTVTFYAHDNMARKEAYMKRMHMKFPDRKIIEL